MQKSVINADWEKTKTLTNGRSKGFNIEGEELEFVVDFNYSGQIISFNCRVRKKYIKEIIEHFKVFSKEIFLMNLKGKVLIECVYPCIFYLCQTWALIKYVSNRLRITQNKMLRSVLGVRRQEKKSITKKNYAGLTTRGPSIKVELGRSCRSNGR